jgi:ATP-dependent Clp protease ATP-binding subunit ClpB
MSSNFDFTDKTQETLAAAIQLAKDYANAHGMHSDYVMTALPF